MLCFLIFLMFKVVMPYALWSCLYDDTLLDLLCLMLRCLTFPASWCLMSSSPRYSFWSCLRVFFTLLDLLYIKPHCLPLTKPCFAAWSSLYHVRLPDLVFMMPGCLILSTSCCAASPSLPHVKLLDVVYIRLWNLICLHDARLLGLLYLLLRCWAFPPHVRLFHAARCCIVWSYPPHATLLHHPPYLLLLGVFDIRSLIFDSLILPWRCYTARPWLPHVALPDVPYIRLCFLIWSAWC